MGFGTLALLIPDRAQSMTAWIQSAATSTRAVVSSCECGQVGPVLSTATRNCCPCRPWRKYGAPESYTQALVSACGALATMPMVQSATLDTVNRPVRSCRPGAGTPTPSQPKPVSRTTSVTDGGASGSL